MTLRTALCALAALCLGTGLAMRFGTPASAAPAATPACRAFAGLAGSRGDAAPALLACIASTASGGDVPLAPGRYVLRSRVVIDRPVHLLTGSMTAAAKACQPGGDARCATLILVPGPADRALPFAVLANGARIDAIVFQGARAIEPAAGLQACAAADRKPAGGGLQVQGDAVAITRSVFEMFTCYTALEFETGIGAKISNNSFSANGAHDTSQNWSDGLTIHDGKQLVISGNRFVDNTDVQLIFGGCQGCTVTGNSFRHTGKAAGGSFAELMLHAWPKGATSGDFTGTTVSGNAIDCTVQKRCGFGLMIGASPWYQAATFGGTVRANRVANAMVGLNVNDLTGPMQITDNRITASGGRNVATCGMRDTAAVNVSLASERFVGGSIAGAGHASFVGCLLNHPFARAPG